MKRGEGLPPDNTLAFESPCGSSDRDSSECDVPSRRIESEDSEGTVVLERRSTLPVKRPNKRVSIWKLLSHLIGKDLSRVSMPIFICEPLSFLQRVSEDFRGHEVLSEASRRRTSTERTAWVSVFAATAFCHTTCRISKPFNPLLGETYELTHFGFRFLAEQVSHHPPVSAYHCEGLDFVAWGDINPTTSFAGNTFDATPEGTIHVHLRVPAENAVGVQSMPPETRTPGYENSNSSDDYVWEYYTWVRPHSTVHNILVGSLWMEWLGEVAVRNHSTGDVTTLEFLPTYHSRSAASKSTGNMRATTAPTSWFDFGRKQEAAPDRVLGTARDAGGRERYTVGGCYSSALWIRPIEDTDEDVSSVDTSNRISSDGGRELIEDAKEYRSMMSRRTSAPSTPNTEGAMACLATIPPTGGFRHPVSVPANLYKQGKFLATLGKGVDLGHNETTKGWKGRELELERENIVWRAPPLTIESQRDYYCLTHYAMQLNEMTPDYDPACTTIPSSDSRLRPDQRLWESALLDEAQAQKLRLEEKQRQAARARKRDNETWTPRWFHLAPSPLSQSSHSSSSTSEFQECVDSSIRISSSSRPDVREDPSPIGRSSSDTPQASFSSSSGSSASTPSSVDLPGCSAAILRGKSRQTHQFEPLGSGVSYKGAGARSNKLVWRYSGRYWDMRDKDDRAGFATMVPDIF